jgi:hypothetical protein
MAHGRSWRVGLTILIPQSVSTHSGGDRRQLGTADGRFRLDGDPESAMRLAEKITRLPNPFDARLVYRKGWSGLTNLEDVRRAIGILEDRGWVKVVALESVDTKGAPAEQVWINPRAQGKL